LGIVEGRDLKVDYALGKKIEVLFRLPQACTFDNNADMRTSTTFYVEGLL
jgi:hypothetical protein